MEPDVGDSWSEPLPLSVSWCLAVGDRMHRGRWGREHCRAVGKGIDANEVGMEMKAEGLESLP